MIYALASACISPLLIAQALYVRFVTPRLPEPSGGRSGITGSGRDLTLLILGDSAAAGVGVPEQSMALSGRLAKALGTDFRVSWKLIAQTGKRAKDISALLEEIRSERFDVVVTSIGVNDVTHGTGTGKWISEMGRIIKILQSKFFAQHIILSGVPPMHLFPALPQPLRWFFGARAGQFNSALKNFTGTRICCETVFIEFPSGGEFVAADGFHPGAPAYTLWAEHVASVIRRRMSAAEQKT